MDRVVIEEYKIEKGIPVPPSRTSKDNLNELLHKMEVGDSITIKKSDDARIRQFATYNKKGFTIRKTPEGYRTWRIK